MILKASLMDSQLRSFVRFLLIRFLIDSDMFWSGSPLILNWLRMDPPLTLNGWGLDCQLILQSKLHEAHTENAV